MKNKVKNVIKKAKKNLKNLAFGTVVSLGLAGGMNSASAQSPDRVIYDMFDHPTKTNTEWVNMNKSQKESYLDSALIYDKSHESLWDPVSGYVYPGTLCGNLVGQMLTNFTGVSNLDTLDKTNFSFKHYDFSNNGKWAVPMQDIGTTADIGNSTQVAHATSGTITGDSATKFDNWYFADSYHHTRTQPGNWDMVDGKPIQVDYYTGVSDKSGPPSKKVLNVLRFEKIDGKYINTYKDPSVVLTKYDDEAPKIEKSINKKVITNRPDTLRLDYNIHDGEFVETKRYGNLFPFDYDFYSGHFLDSGYYKIDNEKKVNLDFSKERENSDRLYPVYNKSGTIPLNSLSEGEHQVVISASDYKGKGVRGNIATDTTNIVVDQTKPSQNASMGLIEGTDSASVSVDSWDKYLDYSKYRVNDSDWKYFSNDTSINIKLKEGLNKLELESADKAGNISSLEKTLVADLTNPELVYEGIENGKVYDSNISGEVKAFDENLKDYGYRFVKNTEKSLPKEVSLYNTNGKFNFDLDNGEYAVQFYAIDDFGNKTNSDTINFGINKQATGLEGVTKGNTSNFYPNPFNEDATYEYNPSGDNVSISLYNMNGQEVYKTIDTDNDGKLDINLTNSPKGSYIYKASDGSSGIVVKN